MNQFVAGATAMACFTAGLFFLKFWVTQRDRLFAMFALAFCVLGLNRVAVTIVDPLDEARTWPYLIRLGAFALIVIAIVDKNRTRKQRSKRRPNPMAPHPPRDDAAGSA